jgi:nucleotide-binding universal stress UspA family protein
MKSILLHVHDDESMETRLQFALDVCRAMDAHLTCLLVTTYDAYATFDPMGGMGAQTVLVEGLRESESNMQAQTETRLLRDDVRWDWVAARGDVAGIIVAQSALCDLVIVSQCRDADRRPNKPLPIVDDVVVHAACAVMVVPDSIGSWRAGEAAVIGWNASPEAAHAIRAALPFLHAASSVHIVSVGEDNETFPQTAANTYLSRHGVASDLHELTGSNRKAAKVLLDFAKSKRANCLVMGAYGRSRLRETLLGGATRSLLSDSDVPLLLSH